MKTLGFTGTRNIGDREFELMEYLYSPDMTTFLRTFDVYVTGACRGWDAFVGRNLALRFPYPVATHLVLVPANRAQVDPWWEEFDLGAIQIVYTPDETDYRYRNEEIVRRADHVFYCADYPEAHGKSKRSGTWMTKRIADQADVPVDGIILNQE